MGGKEAMPNPSTLQREVTTKAWGESILIYRDDSVEIVKARIKAGGFSSLHRHVRKHNHFHVLSGRLQISLLMPNGELATYTLTSGPNNLQSTTAIAAGRWHRFTALTDVECVEVYVSADGSVVNPDDIERRDVGGLQGGPA